MIQLLPLLQSHLSQVLWLLIASGNPLLAAGSIFLEHRVGITKSLWSSSHPAGVAFSPLLPLGDPRVSSAGHRMLVRPWTCTFFLQGKIKSRIKQLRVRRAKGGRRGYLVSAVVFLWLC